MITSFNTASAGSATPATAGKSNNTFLYLIGAAVIGFLGYEFIWKPMQLKKKQKEQAAKG
jgi:threonine/homoserine/homoserine lactone efflux protein